MLEERKAEPGRRQQRMDEAVEKYSFRPQLEVDRERVQKDTATREIRKAMEG